jgi:hypothetical protein
MKFRQYVWYIINVGDIIRIEESGVLPSDSDFHRVAHSQADQYFIITLPGLVLQDHTRNFVGSIDVHTSTVF